MHVAAGEEKLSLRWWGLAAAAADHDLAVGDDIGDAGQVAVADGVGDAGAGRALDRPAAEMGGDVRLEPRQNIVAAHLREAGARYAAGVDLGADAAGAAPLLIA